MLTRILNVNGVGLLHQASGSRQKLEQVAFIYAGNGRGKSTVSSILRSVALGDARQLISRRTIDGTNEQLIKLQFEHGQQALFQDRSWDCHRSEIIVFDSHFIEANVYSGAAVTSEHRRNLLDFAIGDRAVTARFAEEVAVESHRTASAEIARLEGLVQILAGETTIAAFESLEPETDLVRKRKELIQQQTDATRVDAINRQALPSRISHFEFDLEHLFEVLSTELSDLEVGAESVVRAHLENVRGEEKEEWVSQGLAHQDGDECPYCSQSTTGIELIRMYRTYFNRDFLALKERIRECIAKVDEATSPDLITRVARERELISEQINSWVTYVPLEQLTADGDQLIIDSLEELRSKLSELLVIKSEHPGDRVGDETSKADAQAILEQSMSTIRDQNDLLDAHELKITEFKTALSDVDAEAIAKEIARLSLIEARHRADTIELLRELDAAKTALGEAERSKRQARDALTAVMSTTLTTYLGSINAILSDLGAAFSIQRLRNNYQGGAPRSEYEISLRGRPVQLTGSEPSFETALSEGDKRSLAFAFFVASTLADPNLSAKTVVVDDPVSSLDSHRRHKTIELLKQIADASGQLIVLAHDAVFLRTLRNSLNKVEPRPISIMQIRRVEHKYSDFDDLDLDRECETPYYTKYRVVSEFIAGTSHDAREAAEALRLLMEGYLHLRFPGLIAEGLTLGKCISDIAGAVPPSPLVHMLAWIDELRELNTFAGQFHHDTNPRYASVIVDEASVLTYAERIMNFIHGGPVPQ
jgi:wobble nucleotide-excising tRNase